LDARVARQLINNLVHGK